ncbi:predicted protein [Botrytis cinerea T4]|uniref:Uncharacterized protein n=1 Tax=Botryotinia fuckeliana (strain T4) TaxID=999810 RepID=G2YVM4_BOTF4|nr:predicted protein [Botrytis cinerea T4]
MSRKKIINLNEENTDEEVRQKIESAQGVREKDIGGETDQVHLENIEVKNQLTETEIDHPVALESAPCHHLQMMKEYLRRDNIKTPHTIPSATHLQTQDHPTLIP